MAGAASAASLNSYPNFCRVIPSDITQFDIISKIMSTAGWNCAIFLYSNNIYGNSAKKTLQANYQNIGIIHSLMFDTENDESFSDIVNSKYIFFFPFG